MLGVHLCRGRTIAAPAQSVGEGMVRPEIMKEVQMIEDSLKRRVSVGAKISQAKVVKEFTKQVRELASQAHWHSHLTPLLTHQCCA